MSDIRPLLLLVDDTPENLDVLVGMLQHEYRLRVAPNGETALRLCRLEPMPDLVLLDLMMPGVDGFEVCNRLKSEKLTKDIPIIFVTASGESSDESKGFALGAVDYVTKPFSPHVVRARIRTHLDLHHQRRRLWKMNLELEDLNRTLESRVRERTAELEWTRLELIRSLGQAAEFKDDDTGSHILRMSHYSQLIARTAGMSEDFAELLLHASPMHDIGKIGIPDNILLKPGKLDDLEWVEMRKHPEIGVRILGNNNSELLSACKTVALTHHEKWDGTGYPSKQFGEDIPIMGRIVAIADVFDALTSKRPYKDPWPVEKAIELLKDSAGKHFDPRLVHCFVEALPEVLTIKTTYADE